jgi:transcriptional regulator with XRE-family HTH domain
MPKRRPREFLNRLGRRLKARRVELDRTRWIVAKGAEISTTQLSMYESGMGHPPAATLHRLAVMLGTTCSELMGERTPDDRNEQFDVLVRLYNDPFIGSVTRYMQEMTVTERKYLAACAAAIRNMPKPAQTVAVMK